ncbi:RimK family protein [Massilia sp. BJB1822]|uniref:RimK family protein n=1 Tax=Massilia sp. BJB1822 TaxID=2744470 RepID=UPI001593E0BB|nr:RimK family protein [Massilia sp. BJB1822]NVE00671.1 RimK family protein [Massilia sp. BJB1822]
MQQQSARHLLIVVDSPGDWDSASSDCTVMSAAEFLNREPVTATPAPTIVNLCRSYKYLSVGYYCSLMAEARGQTVLPSVKTINDLSRKAIYSLDTSELDHALNAMLGKSSAQPMPVEFSMDIYFGETDYTPLAPLARQIFDTFPTPLMRVEFAREGDWRIAAMKVQSIGALNDDQTAACQQALVRLDRVPQGIYAGPKRYRYHIAILHDPEETLPPSNELALSRFVTTGRELGVDVSLIGKQDFARIGEFDALFIRETTAINHHTYRFAKKAESEGIVVIDDSASILRCTNKIYLADLMRLHDIPIPRTYALQKADIGNIARLEQEIGYPMVMKIPDGAFSRGVTKVASHEQFQRTAQELLQQSSLILVQEYVYTEFDWRIGVLNKTAIFASKYFMSAGHWQVAKRDANGNAEFGLATAVPLSEVPADLLAYAVMAANLIGDGLYGVDMKMTAHGPVVIEVNDNPNIDAGGEDSILGDELYRSVLRDLVRRLDLVHSIA